MESESIQLIVKSPNQSMKDFPVECRPNWSVRVLKQRLSMTYPSKPSPSNQRLIHSGKLLQDHMITGEVLKQPEGGGVVTVHLVCVQSSDSNSGTVSSSPSPSSSVATSSPGVTERQQSVPSATEGIGQPSAPSSSLATPSPATDNNGSHQFRRSMSVDSFYTAATPHRFYRQQSLATPPVYNPPNVAQATPPFVHPMYAAYMHHWYQQQQQLRHRRVSAASTSSTGASISERNEEENGRPEHVNDPDIPAAERRENEQFQDNVAVNAGPGMADMGQNDFRRDWVDSFYKLFSFLLLMTLVYFSASLSKFLAFAIIIILLLIYQAGWFSVRRNRQVRNPVGNDAAPPVAAGDRVATGDASENNEAVDGVEEEGPSVLGTVVMFITTFFTSLVPQRAPELAGN